MATATLTFDLNDPGDRREHIQCSRAGEMLLVIYDFNIFLREKLKYSECSDEKMDAYQEVSDKLHELINDSDLSNLIFE